jgi:predicted NUDIX family NTP pyrophosphohydrolase
MAGRTSAGILVYRKADAGVEVLLGHMGGPLWARKDAGAWSFPKGECGPDEAPLAAARREFGEELGLPVPDGELVALGSVPVSGGKTVTMWAVQGEVDVAAAVFGTFEMVWPPGSGRLRRFPELDRVGWFGVADAREKLTKGQRPFLDRLTALIAG